MSYTPFARWRNFTLENLKSMLELYPDLLDKTARNTVADNIENVFPGYKKTAYQFGFGEGFRCACLCRSCL